MRPATPEEIAEAVPHTSLSPVMLCLVNTPRTWMHVSINETGYPGNLQQQMDALADEADRIGVDLHLAHKPGSKAGGFLVMVR